MKLRFLGQTYSLPSPKMPTVLSKNKACYRGQQYNIRVPVANIDPRSPETQISACVRKYRGVSYIVERRLPEHPNKRELCRR